MRAPCRAATISILFVRAQLFSGLGQQLPALEAWYLMVTGAGCVQHPLTFLEYCEYKIFLFRNVHLLSAHALHPLHYNPSPIPSGAAAAKTPATSTARHGPYLLVRLRVWPADLKRYSRRI